MTRQGEQALEPRRVLELRQISRDGYLLKLEPVGSFRAGQSTSLSTDPARIAPRMYSIASGTGDESWEILFNLVDGGELTPELLRLRPGDRVYAGPAEGGFTDTAETTSWWIASGTGIAPFASMVRSGTGGRKTLIHGARYLDGFYYAEEMRGALGTHYLPCCSGESAPGVYAGRLTNYLRSLPAFPRDSRYMLCGATGMIIEVREILIAAGVPFGNIVSEIYF